MMLSRFSSSPLKGVFVAAVLTVVGLAAAGAAQASPLPTLSIAVGKASATVTGPLESGGVNVVTTNTGVKEASVILFLLKPGVSVAQAETFTKEKRVKGDPNNTEGLGSIVFDAEAARGKTGEAQTELQPGTYLLLVGSGEGEAALRGNFVVTAAKSPVKLTAPEATVRTIEFAFRGAKQLHDGELVRFENEGFVVHMDIAAPVKNMKAAEQLIKDLKAGKEKAAEKLIIGPPAGFAGPLSRGAYQQETITAKPGVYVQVCFMQTQDGRDHAVLGMERIINIIK